MKTTSLSRVTPGRGFTLIEMLVVIAVILILVGIALPNFIGAMDKARVASAKTFLVELKGAVAIYYTDTGQYPESGSQHLYYFLGGVYPASTIKNKNYHPPYMEFNTKSVGPMDFFDNYDPTSDLGIRAKSGQSLNSLQMITISPYYKKGEEVDTTGKAMCWRPILDPWGRPIVYISPKDLTAVVQGARYTEYSTPKVEAPNQIIPLIAWSSERIASSGNFQFRPFGYTSGQFWSAGKDGVTAPSNRSGGDPQPGSLNDGSQVDINSWD